MVLEERCPVHAGELRTLIRMNQHLVLRLSLPHSHQQSLQYDVIGLSTLHRPADDTARIEVGDNRKVSETFAGSNVSNVRHSGSVWSRHVELPVERIIYDDRRSTAVDAGTAFLTDLRLDPGEAR